jgi:hypothetical protein
VRAFRGKIESRRIGVLSVVKTFHAEEAWPTVSIVGIASQKPWFSPIMGTVFFISGKETAPESAAASRRRPAGASQRWNRPPASAFRFGKNGD